MLVFPSLSSIESKIRVTGDPGIEIGISMPKISIGVLVGIGGAVGTGVVGPKLHAGARKETTIKILTAITALLFITSSLWNMD